MNKILKGILSVAEDIAEKELPGVKFIVGGAKILFDRDNSNNSLGIAQISNGTIQAIEAIKKEDIIDENKFNSGFIKLKSGFDEIRQSVR